MEYVSYRRRRKKNPARFLLLVMLGGFLMYYLAFHQTSKKSSTKIVSPIASTLSSPSVAITPTASPANSLAGAIEKAMEGTNGTYGIYIKNLKTGQTYTSNEHRIFEPGSLYKLWVMATVFQQIQNGTLKEDQVLTQTIPMLNSKFGISPEYAELTEGTISLTITQALTQMITISHNYAALLLTEKVKLSAVSTFLQTYGFRESKVGTNGNSPNSTPYDIALFLEKLYKGQLANVENTNKMIDLLKKQQLNNKLPKYLPDNVVIAHKTGEIDFFSHDAGIVYTPKGDYIIVIFSESNSPLGAEERIANTSKAVYDYFMNLRDR